MKKYRVTEAEMEKALVLAGQMIRCAEEGLSIPEDLARQLEIRTGYQEAGKEADAIHAGVVAFKQMQLTLKDKTPEEMVMQHLDAALAPHEHSLRMSMLSCLLQNVADEAGVAAQFPEVYEEKAYKEAICQYISRYAVADMLGSTNWIGSMLDTKAVAKMCALNKSLEKDQYLAAALYILQRRGELSHVPESVSPYELGVLAAASTATAREICLAALGKVDWKFLGKILTIIAVACALCLFTVTAYYILPEIFLVVEEFFGNILVKLGLAGSIMSTMFGLAAAGGTFWMLIVASYETWESANMSESCKYVADSLKKWHDDILVPGTRKLLAQVGVPVNAQAEARENTAAQAEEPADAPA